MPHVSVDNRVRLYYEKTGSGIPLVFLHGVWASSRYFVEQQQNPIRGVESVFIDFRGHGQSDACAYGHSVSQYAVDVHHVLKALGLKKVILVGWSMGALVAWEYLRIFGEADVRGLVVVDQTPSDYKFADWPYGAFSFDSLESIQKMILETPETIARENARSIFHQPALETTSLCVEEFLKVNPAAAHSIFTDQTFRDYRSVARRSLLPVILCFGGKSSMTTPAAAEYLSRDLAHAQLVLFDKSSHCPFLEEPVKFNQVVAEFAQTLL